MSVENQDTIDFISVDRDANVVLTISDHLQWDADNEHLLILQDKINAYLGAIESGQLVNAYPNAAGRKIIISVVARCVPNENGRIFLERVKTTLESAGYGFRFEQTYLDVDSGSSDRPAD